MVQTYVIENEYTLPKDTYETGIYYVGSCDYGSIYVDKYDRIKNMHYYNVFFRDWTGENYYFYENNQKLDIALNDKTRNGRVILSGDMHQFELYSCEDMIILVNKDNLANKYLLWKLDVTDMSGFLYSNNMDMYYHNNYINIEGITKCRYMSLAHIT